MGVPDKLGILVCEHLHAAAAERTEATRLGDIRLLPFSHDCSRQNDGWHEIQRAAAMGPDCRQFHLLGGRCVTSAALPELAGRPMIVTRGCPSLPEALSELGRERLKLLIEKAALEWRMEAQRERLSVMLAS